MRRPSLWFVLGVFWIALGIQGNRWSDGLMFGCGVGIATSAILSMRRA